MHFVPLRLTPNSDLRRALEEAAVHDGQAAAFVVSGIGSLTGATLRLAGAENQTHLTGMFEIICLSRTICRDGAHLHMTVADSSGKVLGGHVCYGNEVRTTVEVLLAHLPAWKFSRELDPATGFSELTVSPVFGNVA